MLDYRKGLNPLLPLIRSPLIFVEMLVASFAIALLGLASPIFSMQVLNRYISHGFDGTLITLTIGVFIALIFLMLIRIVRNQILSAISLNTRKQAHEDFLSSLMHASLLTSYLHGSEAWQKNMHHQNILERIFLPSSMATYLDAPFCFLYVGFIFLINKVLGWVTIGVVVLYVGGVEIINRFYIQENTRLTSIQQGLRSNVLSLFSFLEELKQRPTREFVRGIIQPLFESTQRLLSKVLFYGELSGSHQRTVGMLLNILIYAFGGVETVEGRLTIGGLIGASILSSRAFGGITSFFLLKRSIRESKRYGKEFYEFIEDIKEESPSHIVIPREFRGEIRLSNVSFSYPGSINPVFEQLNMALEPGASMAIIGFNGCGKTTFIRLLCKLLFPTKGYILIDNNNLSHIDTSWWMQQIIYVPQEPCFLPLSIRENILLGRDIGEERLEEILILSDLMGFIKFSPKGLDTTLTSGGRHLSVGIRKRIAFARALVSDGQIVIMDEPTTHLDITGKKKLYHLLNRLKKDGKTIIIATDDVAILRGSEFILNLGKKPSPIFTPNKKNISHLH